MSATGLIPVQTVTSGACASPSSPSPEYPSSRSSPVPLDVAELRDAAEYDARLSPSSQWDTVPKRGLEKSWEGGKPRPPSVALCAAIGEASKGDCTTDGHLQATMIPFVQPLPSPLIIKLSIITQSFTFSVDSHDLRREDQAEISIEVFFFFWRGGGGLC